MCISWLKYLFSQEEPVVDDPVTDPVDVPEPDVVDSGTTDVIDEPIIVTPMPKPYEGINFHILLDNGHASSTPGKRQLLEDGSYFFEYEFNRDVVRRIAGKLDSLGIPYDIIVPEIDKDIALSERAARANSLCTKYGTANCFFISVHSNAFGDGKTFTDAKGWSVWTTKGPTKSDEYATTMFGAASDILPKYDMTTRSQMTDGDPDLQRTCSSPTRRKSVG